MSGRALTLAARLLLITFCCVVLSACATAPRVPWSPELQPLTLGGNGPEAVQDGRARFRTIFCALSRDQGDQWPDHRPCGEALSLVGREAPTSHREVHQGAARTDFLTLMVPGLGFECVRDWLNQDLAILGSLRQKGFDVRIIEVEGLSSSSRNAELIDRYVHALPEKDAQRPLVLLGYSKGTPDILEALVKYPALAEKTVAIVSFAGAVRGSPLATTRLGGMFKLLEYMPGSDCDGGDGGALESLFPEVRTAFLAENQLPRSTRYYSLASFPDPETRMSAALKPSWRKLAKMADVRNDGQLVFLDQLLPGSTLLGFANADHWAMGVPIARHHSIAAASYAGHNDFPREIMLEALLRQVEEDLLEALPAATPEQGPSCCATQ